MTFGNVYSDSLPFSPNPQPIKHILFLFLFLSLSLSLPLFAANHSSRNEPTQSPILTHQEQKKKKKKSRKIPMSDMTRTKSFGGQTLPLAAQRPTDRLIPSPCISKIWLGDKGEKKGKRRGEGRKTKMKNKTLASGGRGEGGEETMLLTFPRPKTR